MQVRCSAFVRQTTNTLAAAASKGKWADFFRLSDFRGCQFRNSHRNQRAPFPLFGPKLAEQCCVDSGRVAERTDGWMDEHRDGGERLRCSVHPSADPKWINRSGWNWGHAGVEPRLAFRILVPHAALRPPHSWNVRVWHTAPVPSIPHPARSRHPTSADRRAAFRTWECPFQIRKCRSPILRCRRRRCLCRSALLRHSAQADDRVRSHRRLQLHLIGCPHFRVQRAWACSTTLHPERLPFLSRHHHRPLANHGNGQRRRARGSPRMVPGTRPLPPAAALPTLAHRTIRGALQARLLDKA